MNTWLKFLIIVTLPVMIGLFVLNGGVEKWKTWNKEHKYNDTFIRYAVEQIWFNYFG